MIQIKTKLYSCVFTPMNIILIIILDIYELKTVH